LPRIRENAGRHAGARQRLQLSRAGRAVHRAVDDACGGGGGGM